MKERSADQTAVSISLSKDLLTLIDARARYFNLSRSRYLAILAQQDLTKGGPLVMPAPDATQPPRVVDANTEVVEFLILALTATAPKGAYPPLRLLAMVIMSGTTCQ